MSAKFPEYKALDLPKVAEEILEYWNTNNIFEKSISLREGNTPFVFFEGPPSANGLPGVHHVLARAIKDIFPRYKTMKGFQVKRKAGWDTHGLPIELGVEKELGITKEDIGKIISVEDYNAACRKAVMRYTDIWNDLTQKMGYWVDVEHPYITYEPKYMESVWWLLKQIYNKNLLYKGYTIQPYSPKAGTGLSSHELNQPGTYQDVTDTTVVAQFKAINETLPDFLQNEGTIYFLAWTTTPWTLPSNTALTVGPKIDYVLVDTFNQYTFEPTKVILAKNLVSKQFAGKFKEVEHQSELDAFKESDKFIPYKIIATCVGKDLVGIKYEQLMDYVLPNDHPENAFRVISGDFVTTEDGTGIVHTAPTFGADDAFVAKQAIPEIPPMLVKDDNGNLVPLVDLEGKFRPEVTDLAGKYVKNDYYNDGEAPEKSVDVEIAIKLKEENKAFKVERIKVKVESDRSSDNWQSIGFVNGNGTTTEKNNYSFIDKNLFQGKYKYRLKQIDNDGKYEYSKEIEVSVNNLPTEFALGQNYPNPFNPSTTIKYSVPYESSVKMIVFNTLGEIVKELVSEVKATGNYEVNFNASRLSSGIYFYSLTAQPLNGGESFRSVKKVVSVK